MNSGHEPPKWASGTSHPIAGASLVEVHEVRIPTIGLGTWRLRGEACQRIVSQALEVGYRHIDTAEAYENEAEIGRALRSYGLPRQDLWLTSKIWIDHLDRNSVFDSVRKSCDALGTDHLDLELIHWPNDQVPLDETLEALSDLRQKGVVREIGVSNFPPSLFDEASELTRVFANQVEFHPYLGQGRLHEAAVRRDQVLMAYCPLARGRVAADPVLTAIGERHGKSASQVALRWLVQQPNVVALPKASSRDRLVENFDVFDFTLDVDEMNAIHRLDRGARLVDPEFAPDWSA